MKHLRYTGYVFICLGISFCFSKSGAQSIPYTTEQQLESLAATEEELPEDDSYLQQLERFKNEPLDLNIAEGFELKDLVVLNDLQVENFIAYRRLLGKLISLYEIQAIPGWDLVTIRKILPFIKVGSPLSIKEEKQSRLKNGNHSVLLRIYQVLEKAKGFLPDSTAPGYLGSPQKILFRYQYAYKNLLQFGLTGEKDAGEPFLKGQQRAGFDFYSFHLCARKMGIIHTLALGDFTVNMGQGLIHWQSLAFKKSVDIMAVKRQSPVIRPYNSAGEFFFHRGVALTLKKEPWSISLFASSRKLSANLVEDNLSHENHLSSFLASGYHRTAGELADRNTCLQTAYGLAMQYRSPRLNLGLNTVYFHFSLPIEKRDEPYNIYSLRGDNWHNISLDFSYTIKNFHLFGEIASDKNLSMALINGIMLSVDPKVDIAFLHRKISPLYQAVYGNAFTEGSAPTNESGIYSGICIRPGGKWRLDAYADLFTFPWLKFNVDAPTSGTDFLLQFMYTPNKQTELFTRFRNETKELNYGAEDYATNRVLPTRRQSWRTQFSCQLNGSMTLRYRVEMIWYEKSCWPANQDWVPDNYSGRGLKKAEAGFLTFFDLRFNPVLKPFGGIARLQYFESGGYDSRIYAYENDVLFNHSIPAAFGKGIRYYLNLDYHFGKKFSVWAKWAQTIYNDDTRPGSALDEINGNRKTEFKLQARYIL
ncbi:MAG TPA: hypothetical protein VFO70_03795 [Chitinophagaceae bacterium]|nr:hypothetical protein [Chitinophagaceae bacterium]